MCIRDRNVAAQRNHLEIIRALVGAGADVTQAREDGSSALFMAAQRGHVDIVRALVKLKPDAGVVNQATINGATPLAVATEYGHVEVVRALVEAVLSKDADQLHGVLVPMAKNVLSMSPLMMDVLIVWMRGLAQLADSTEKDKNQFL